MADKKDVSPVEKAEKRIEEKRKMLQEYTNVLPFSMQNINASCAVCGQQFIMKTEWQDYCSSTCRNRYHYALRKIKKSGVKK